MTLRFEAPAYPGARHCLRCGTVIVGAVFPPAADGDDWRWRQWASAMLFPPEGSAKSESAAKTALLARFREFLNAAELKEMSDD